MAFLRKVKQQCLNLKVLKMSRLAILGASGHGKVVADIAECCGWDEVVFFDDAFPTVFHIGVWDVKGNTDALVSRLNEFNGVIVAIGNNLIRLDKTNFLLSIKAPVVSLIHPSAIVSKHSSIELGSVVMANSVINPFSTIGVGCIVNTAATIDHDCELGDAVHVSPGVNLAGAVKVDDLTWIGIGASIKQCLSIGRNVMIGAGSAVVCDVSDNVVSVGIPSKVIKEL
jgi:sugar O-acyltransferase (sialic acid O-acetyltransferase NeuD family)